MAEWTLTLPSNVQGAGNKINSYRTELTDPIILSREHFRVALMEISYLHSVKTFTNPEDAVIYVTIGDEKLKNMSKYVDFWGNIDLARQKTSKSMRSGP